MKPSPPPSPSLHIERTLSDIMSEIARMQTMIVYYENQIMRKEIAVQEILQGHSAASITEAQINEEAVENRFK